LYVSLFRRSPSPAPVATPDVAADELRGRLRSLHDHCLTNLVAGLDAMNRGDLTYAVAPATTPITTRSENPETQELVDLFNSMLEKAQTALDGYNGVRETMRAALGDQSCLDGLQDRLDSLSGHCLAGLGDGLGAMAQGDLTVAVYPATTPLETAPGQNLGTLGETFNVMLGQAQGGLELYNATRESVAQIISGISETAERVSGASRRCPRPRPRPAPPSRTSPGCRPASPRAPSARCRASRPRSPSTARPSSSPLTPRSSLPRASR
jgi:methyl-accepting chemotaxis protein